MTSLHQDFYLVSKKDIPFLILKEAVDAFQKIKFWTIVSFSILKKLDAEENLQLFEKYFVEFLVFEPKGWEQTSCLKFQVIYDTMIPCRYK